MRIPNRRRRARLTLERLEDRLLLATNVATISGTVIRTVDASGLFPQATATFDAPVKGILVSLDGGTPVATDANGKYSFSDIADGTHVVSVSLTNQAAVGFVAYGGLGNYIQGSARGLSDQVFISNQQSFPNVNFTLAPKTQALVQNLFQLVFGRSPSISGLNAWSSVLTPTPTSTMIGSAFANFIGTPQFASLVAPLAYTLSAFMPNDSSNNPIPTDIGLLRDSEQLVYSGVSQNAAMLNILYSQQFVDKFGDLSPNNTNVPNNTFVTTVYTTLLQRQPTQSELTAWVNKLNAFTVDRGQLILNVVNTPEFAQRRQDIIRRVNVSLAYLGILGRQASGPQMQSGLTYLATPGATLAGFASVLAGTAEYRSLPGFTSTLVWDTVADQIEPAVDPLSRLSAYDPATRQFDLTVTPRSITSTSAKPVNLYVVAHGWAPGSTEAVLLGSTPGNPLKVWQTSNSLLEGTITEVSSTGLAQSIVDADPNAIVLAYSWVDQSATPTPVLSSSRLGSMNVKSPSLLNIASTSGLYVGMSVVGPNLPSTSTTITAILSSTQVMLSTKATTSVNGVTYTFSPTSPAQVVVTGTANAANKTITVATTNGLSLGMTVTGPGITVSPATTITGLTATKITLSQAPTTQSNKTYTFTGADAAAAARVLAYAGQSEGFTQLSGLEMAQAITAALSPAFFLGQGLLHLMGHSHGSKVATVAALALDQQGLPITQLTLFDSPETGPNALGINFSLPGLAGAQNFLWYYLAQMNISTTPVLPGTRIPTPAGGVATVSVTSPGSNYSAGATVTFSAPQNPQGLTATGTPIIKDGMITGITITNPGGGYTSAPTVTINDSSGTGAAATATLNSFYPTFVDNYFSTQGVGTSLGNFTGLQSFGSVFTTNSLANLVDVQLNPQSLYGPIGLGGSSIVGAQQFDQAQSPIAGAAATVGNSHHYPPGWYAQASLQNPSSPSNQLNGLYWSPLLSPGTTASLGHNYAQPTQTTPGKFVTTQFQLDPKSGPAAVTPLTTPLQYAQQFTVGDVVDNGSSIQLSVGSGNPNAIDAVTFSPLAAFGNSGTGLSLQFQFSGASPQSQVELVVWINGMAGAPLTLIGATGPTAGYISTPLLTINGATAGTTAQTATISLDGFEFGSLINGGFNTVVTSSGKSAAPFVPTLGFSLISTSGSDASGTVTVSLMNQYGVASLPTVMGVSPPSTTSPSPGLITLTGANLSGATKVTFTDTSTGTATEVTTGITSTPTSLTLMVPSGLAAGTYDITVKTSLPDESIATLADRITIVAPPPGHHPLIPVGGATHHVVSNTGPFNAAPGFGFTFASVL